MFLEAALVEGESLRKINLTTILFFLSPLPSIHSIHFMHLFHQQGLLIKPLLEKVMSRRGGRLPGFLLVCGDDPSDDKMVEVKNS